MVASNWPWLTWAPSAKQICVILPAVSNERSTSSSGSSEPLTVMPSVSVVGRMTVTRTSSVRSFRPPLPSPLPAPDVPGPISGLPAAPNHCQATMTSTTAATPHSAHTILFLFMT